MNFLFNCFVELKREATARCEIRDKVKEEQTAAVTDQKEMEERKHTEPPPQAADNSKQGQ